MVLQDNRIERLSSMCFLRMDGSFLHGREEKMAKHGKRWRKRKKQLLGAGINVKI